MSCIYKIKKAEKSFTKTEKIIANYILNNRLDVIENSAQTLADCTHTSAAAWIRFSHKLGYKGITALKLDLSKYENIEEKDELFNIMIEQKDSLDEMVKKVHNISLRTLEETYKLLNLSSLKKAIHLIKNAKNIYLAGVGGSGLVCEDLMLKLTRINHNIIYHKDSHVLLARVAHMTKNDVLIAVSYSGETNFINAIVKKSRELNTPVIAITQYNVRSSLSKLADITLYTPLIEKDLRLGAISSRNASLAVTDLLYYGIIKEDIEKVKDNLIKTRSLIHEVDKGKKDIC